MGQMASISCEIFWPPGAGIVIARYRPNLQTSKVLFSFLTWRNYYFEIQNGRSTSMESSNHGDLLCAFMQVLNINRGPDLKQFPGFRQKKKIVMYSFTSKLNSTFRMTGNAIAD